MLRVVTHLLQVELEIMLPEEMSVKESHDIALMLQHKVPMLMAKAAMLPWALFLVSCCSLYAA